MLPLQTAVEILTEYPELALALGIVLRVARAYQTSLTWPEYRAAHRFKRGVLPLLNRTRLGDAILLVSDKQGRDDPEFQATVAGTVPEVVRDLRRGGGSLHLVCALKRRPDAHGDPLTGAHLVWTVDGGAGQIECYAFANDGETVDVFCHTETGIQDPLGHLTDPQADGDTHGVVPALKNEPRD